MSVRMPFHPAPVSFWTRVSLCSGCSCHESEEALFSHLLRFSSHMHQLSPWKVSDALEALDVKDRFLARQSSSSQAPVLKLSGSLVELSPLPSSALASFGITSPASAIPSP